MPATFTLTTIEHAVQIGTKLSESWFRGHDRVFNELTPAMFRTPYSEDIYQAFRPDLELEMIEEFKRHAPTLAVGGTLPSEKDHLGWLYVMRHYGAPTRLLDWTESVLVALWFTVVERHDADGELWALFPKSLNKHASGSFGFPIIGNDPVVEFLAEEPYWEGPPEILAERLELESPVIKPVAFRPRRSFARMVVQSSTFTIHPRPSQGNTIPDILADNKHLARWIIPAETKQSLRDALIALGITHVTLFPDYEGLSKTLIESARHVGYGPPEPPQCAGPFDAWRKTRQ